MGARGAEQLAERQECSLKTRAAVEQLFVDGNRDALVGELRSRISQAEAEDLIQRSIERALSGRCRAEHVGGVHAWVRQDAQFALSHLLDRRRVAREKLTRERNALPRPDELPGPEARILREGNTALAEDLVEEAGLSPLDQNIVRLYWGERLPRKQVAGELGIAEGTLKKRLARAGTAFENLLVKRCGGGCGGDGQRWVIAYAFQHRRMPEEAELEAVGHMESCEPCARLFARLEQVRLAVAASAPVTLVAEPTEHVGLADRVGDAFAWVREQVSSLSVRAHELATAPPPVRPGAALASIGVCAVAAGGSYCLEGAVPPLKALIPPAAERPAPVRERPAAPVDRTADLDPQPGIAAPGAATPLPAPAAEPVEASPSAPEPAVEPPARPAAPPSQEFDFEQASPPPAPRSSPSDPGRSEQRGSPQQPASKPAAPAAPKPAAAPRPRPAVAPAPEGEFL